jgi:hypothetical protein
MATRAKPKRSQENPRPHSQPKHPWRIVPLHGAPRVAAATTPRLTYRGGPLLTNVEVFTLFWGGAWQQPQNAPLATQLNGFFDFVLTSKLMDQLAEYNVPGKSIGHGSRTGTFTLFTEEPGKTVQDGAIQDMLRAQLEMKNLPKANANSLYFVYLPPGTKAEQGGSASCADFCGYHEATTENIFYAVMPFPGCAGCEGGLVTFDALTSTSSHELCEAITDPIPGQGWYDDANGEIGDICAWKTRRLGGFTVQLEWSNAAEACV